MMVILEKKKYEVLKNLNSYYVNVFNFFGLGTYIVVWKIGGENDFEFKKMLCKKCTDNGKKEYIEKSVTMLNINNSIQIVEYKNEDYIYLSYNDFLNKINLNNQLN